MLRRHAWNQHDKSELSFEETLAFVAGLPDKLECVSEETWKLIASDKPYSEDTLNQIQDCLIDDLCNNAGPSVLTLAWDGDGMAHSGIKGVEKWGPLFVFKSSDHDDHGPFRTIKDALGLEYFWQEGVPRGELWFDQDIVPEALAMKIAHAMCGDENECVFVNDVKYVRRGSELLVTFDPDALTE